MISKLYIWLVLGLVSIEHQKIDSVRDGVDYGSLDVAASLA
jgi:hypothetical protein